MAPEGKTEEEDVPPPPSPPKGKPVVLPPNWKTAKDAEGKMYYYHTVTRYKFVCYYSCTVITVKIQRMIKIAVITVKLFNFTDINFCVL